MIQVAVDGLLWSYEEVKGKDIPIVILHGWGRSGKEWLELARYLNKRTGRKILIPDLPGFGGSAMRVTRDIYEYSSHLVKWLQYLNISKASIVGHSLGGRIGVVLGAKFPEMVENLVLIAPAAVKPFTWRRLLLKPISCFAKAVPIFWREKLARVVSDEDGQDLIRRELYKAIVKIDLRYELPQIYCPTLVIWGERDQILPIAILNIYKKFIQKLSVRVIWEAGHDPHLTHFRDLARIVEEIWI